MKKLLIDLGVTILYNLYTFFLGLILCCIFMRTDFLYGIVYIYYFRAMAYAILSALIVGAATLLLVFLKKSKTFKFLDSKLIFSGFAISFLLIFTFFGLGPFCSDRSFTIFSLGYLYENADKSYTQEEMEQIFIDGFVKNFGATKKRIGEQMSTGYIKELDGKYFISESGKRFIKLLRLIDFFFPTATNPSSLYPNGNHKREFIKD
jgi:hypothetical protein